MRKKSFSFIVLVIFLLTSCAPAQPAPTQTPLPISTFTPQPTATLTPTPTPNPLFDVIDELQRRGINVIHENDQWILKLGEIEVPDAYFDENGQTLHIQTKNAKINIPVDQVLERVNVVYEAIVVDNASGNHTAVYDPSLATEKWSRRWVTKSETIWEDRINAKGYINVNTWSELDELREIARLLSDDFPPNAYLPPLENIFVDYEKSFRKAEDLKGEFNQYNPFGIRSDASTSPFMWVNFVLLLPNEDEGRNYYACIAMEAVLNIDRSKGILQIGSAGKTPEECSGWMRGSMGEGDGSLQGNYSLPEYDWDLGTWGKGGWWDIHVDNYRYLGILKREGLDSTVKDAVVQWLTTGMLQKGGILERMIGFGVAKSFYKLK